MPNLEKNWFCLLNSNQGYIPKLASLRVAKTGNSQGCQPLGLPKLATLRVTKTGKPLGSQNWQLSGLPKLAILWVTKTGNFFWFA